MRAGVGILAVATSLIFSGCVALDRAVFEYPVSVCPPAEFLLPAMAKDADATARYVSSDTQCRGAALYDFSRSRGAEQLHVRIERGSQCSLLVASIYPKVCRGRLPEKCEHFKTITRSITDTHLHLARLLLQGQSVSISSSPKKVEVIQSKEDFEKWCAEKPK